MSAALAPVRFLVHEARALLTRLALLRPFALTMPRVPAASPTASTSRAIERFLARRRTELRAAVHAFIDSLHGPVDPAEGQRRFTSLRLRFNNVVSQFDLFADILTQRAEHGTGVWVAGLDAAAADALALPGVPAVDVACYVDRGHGAAIRRARARLWGGARSPVAVVRVPRERMVGGCGIASSLVHEVGHQAAEILDLVPPLRRVLDGLASTRRESSLAWKAWRLWISEIIADFWAVARVGVASTLGLMAVLSLPRPLVLRPSFDDVHPTPWLRLKISAAIGAAMHPDPQWARIASLWESLYPLDGLPPAARKVIDVLEDGIPGLVTLLMNQRPAALKGRSLVEALDLPSRKPERLRSFYTQLSSNRLSWLSLRPSLAFAVVGQARADGRIGTIPEAELVQRLLTHWAVRRPTCACAGVHRCQSA